MARFRSTFSWSTHGRENKNHSFASPSFLFDNYSLRGFLLSLRSLFFTERCVECAKGLFKFRPYLVLSCCIIVYHTLYFYSNRACPSHLKTTSEESVTVGNIQSEPFPLRPTPSSPPLCNTMPITSRVSLRSSISPFHTGMTATYLPLLMLLQTHFDPPVPTKSPT